MRAGSRNSDMEMKRLYGIAKTGLPIPTLTNRGYGIAKTGLPIPTLTNRGYGIAKTGLPIPTLTNRGYGIAKTGLPIQPPLVCIALLSCLSSVAWQLYIQCHAHPTMLSIPLVTYIQYRPDTIVPDIYNDVCIACVYNILL